MYDDDALEGEAPEPEPKNYLLSFYHMGREYGGSEEGGWWYDTGVLIRTFKVVKDQRQAYDLSARANHLLRLLMRIAKRRDRFSMAYGGGDYQVMVHGDKAAEYFPTIRPHYE